jgi:hypothetical protein
MLVLIDGWQDNNGQMNVACHYFLCWWTSWKCNKNCVVVLKLPSFSFQCMELLSNRLLVDVSIEGASSWNANLSCYQIGSSSIFHIYLVAMKTTRRICDPQVKQSHEILVIMSWFRHPCYAPDFVFPFIFCASLDRKVGFCCNMRRIIVSDVRFQILCKGCMVLIKTPIMWAWKQWTI